MAQTEVECSQTKNFPAVEVWDTNLVARSEAFDFYREGICTAFMPLRPERSRTGRQDFHAKVECHKLDRCVLNVVSAQVHSVLRGRSEIAASPHDCFYLNLPLVGHSRISQSGSSITLRAGEVGIFDSAEPFEIQHENHGTLGVASLMMPKYLLSDIEISGPKKLSQHPVFGRILTEATYTLAQTVSSASNIEVNLLQQLIIQLASAATQQSVAPIEGLTQRTAQFLRIKHAIRLNCSKQDFDLTRCGAIVGLSTGYIQQIFSSHSMRFTALLLEERLLLAERNISDPALRHFPISGIAYRSGFSDLSHFGRVFKERFGVSPGVWRKQSTVQRH
ncbi:hypothetical protein MXMO3_00613 [Maritalea myrionectae]|uniref:HTH araC/xylS-type domain-containing protein n=1 Tax=Maritalea myrionectae TaxID=454601 RepID=A0A2R4MAU1_9HYPH|nr:helix-turn-helix domain-containing protein [Maritalea myrionectae]AVX03157.1 hypothetical protein MXMO3_00613 [Maritalea myrionectae]